MKNVTDGLIKGCNIEACEMIGMSISSSGHINISNCSIHNESKESIGISISIGTITLDRNQIFRNRMGIRLSTSNQIKLSNNNIFHNDVGIFIDGRNQVTYIVNRPKHAIINNNNISTNNKANIMLSAGAGPHIFDNIISESNTGISIRDGSVPTIVY